MEKQDLLLKYLSMALPYGVKVQYFSGNNEKIYDCDIDQISVKSKCVAIAKIGYVNFSWRQIDRVKPYLRSIKSMTEEEDDERINLGIWRNSSFESEIITQIDKDPVAALNWLLENHFDFMDLIPKGLAIEVTEENNPY